MKPINDLKYIAKPAKIFTTVLILLIAVFILQSIILETERMFAYTKKRSTTKPGTELTQEQKRQDRIRRSAKEFLSNGTIHLIDRVEHISGRRNQSETVQIYDTNDNLLWEGPRNKRPYKYLSWAKQLRGYKEGFTDLQMKEMQMIRPEFSQNIEILVGSDEKTEQIWRYYPGAQYFKGYNINGEKIGYIGSTGFNNLKSKAKPFGKFRFFTAWFPQDSSSPTLIWQTQKRIYQIDFEKQHVELIFESTESDIKTLSLHAWRFPMSDTMGIIIAENYRPMLHCMMEDGKHHLILREPSEQLSLAVPEDWRNTFVTATKQDIFLHHSGTDAPPPAVTAGLREPFNQRLQQRQGKPINRWDALYKVDNQGSLELLNRYDWTVPVPSTIFRKDPKPAIHRIVSQFSPPFYDLVVRLLFRKFSSWAEDPRNRGDFFYDLALTITDIRANDSFVNRVLSVLMMFFVFIHGWPRRTSWGKFIFWLIFTGLFNIAGLLTYLALNHTAVIKCPVCSKCRGLSQAECVRCRAQLPAPERGKLDLIFDI